ncbi:MAG: hypothetical protein A3D94_16625 [Alphaproteobacteria bacterium RIFCSPHIGHO2_12_FULL_66_14]|nr:MAG: hypothetical protein A3D94_16625 [Alphaproteobacteria bacterium RIFCSPHIGHO2_12_FULL_66_14]
MNKCLSAATAVALALAAGACMQQSTPQQLNTTNANSRIYIGSLTCNIAAGTGYILASSKKMDCVFLGKDGVSTAQYDGTITKVGVDIGYSKAVHTIWRVYSLGSERAANSLSGAYVGEQSSAAAGNQAGGNWLYGGAHAEVGMVASGIIKDAGYNLAVGVAEMDLKLRP